MSHDCHSRLSGRLGRLAEERILLKEPERLRIPNAFGTMTEITKKCGFTFVLISE